MHEDLVTRVITPIKFHYDGADVIIHEVTKSELFDRQVWYHVSLQVVWKGHRSKLFSLDVRDMDELKKRLMIEIPKFKLFIMLMKGGKL